MKRLFFLFIIFQFLVACTTDFEEINNNQNEPLEVTGDLLLPTVIFNVADHLVSDAYGFGDIIAQYAASYEFNGTDIYNWTSDSRYWNMYDYLQDVKEIENYGANNALPDYEGVALILKSFMFSIMTDAYGDIPYSNALQAAEGVWGPSYDKQQAIYEGLIADLTTANDLIDGSGSISGDILFGGDMMKWKKFANSLKVRLLMRSSNAQSVDSEMQKMVDDASTYPMFESNADNAVYSYSGAFPDLSPYSIGKGREYSYYISVPTTHLIEQLEANDDPRIHEWLGYKGGTTDYIGLEPGLDQGDIGRPVDYASRDTSFYEDPSKIKSWWMTYAELQFCLAEAAEKGMINTGAETYYNNAVSASFDQWGVNMPADFLTDRAVYQSGDLDLIYIQKWLAMYQNTVQAWFDWKRTGKPDFIQAGPGNINEGRVPVRLIYPSVEQSVNTSNYEAAVQSIGADNINTRVWWDK